MNGDRVDMRGAVRTRPRVIGAALAAVAIAVVSLSPSAAAGATRTRDAAVELARVPRLQEWGAAEEQAFVAKINQLRASRGLTTLVVDVELTHQSRVWSQTMKDAGNIFHTTNLSGGITSDWEKLGENVGVGGTVDALFDAFVASPKHYENLIDPVYRFVGVGVVWDGSRMFTTHRFMSLMPPAPVTTRPAAPVTAAPTTAPRAPAAPTTSPPPPTTAPAPTEPPPELAATEPAPATPIRPPASPTRIALILSTVDDLFA